MEIIGFYILIVIGFVYRLKQLVEQGAEGNHGPSRVHKEQQLYRVFARLIHDNLQTAAVITGLVYGSVNVKFRLGNIQPCGKLTQFPESQLKLAVVQHPVIPEISVFAGPYYLKGALIARFSSDPDSAHKAAHISESGFSHTADPETSAVMFAVLISQPFLELGLHLVLIDKLDSVLLIHAVALFLVHQINQL